MSGYQPTTPNYGIDAPGIIRTFFLLAVAAAIAGWFLPSLPLLSSHPGLVRGPLLVLALGCAAFGTAMLAYGVRGKFNHRAQMLRMISWTGHEQVLDVGTGLAFLAVGAAKHLTTGHVTGVDIWQAADLSDNTRARAERNIQLEGVADRVTLRHQDARQLDFPSHSFDVIVSLLCIHNIEDAAGRGAACREIARVLRPGGTVLLSDYIGTREYAAILTEAGLRVQPPKSYIAQSYGLMWMVVATKPA
ncbi:class I SAM-dependent methyltransferase [Hymenobacter sp.]|uniref:class I SAM-dependent methyltransferase n=1 Tax=Hymenobacter sp. TaxID=1898978 RepID=UPI00286A3D6A|nr:class I SAM-dependent methyltransferase [Hymenobacter sp.]